MWIPTKLLSLLTFSAEDRAELLALRAERDLLRSTLATSQANFSWLTLRVNSLEVERAQLIKIAYNINAAIPEIVATPRVAPTLNSAIFDHIEDEPAPRTSYAN